MTRPFPARYGDVNPDGIEPDAEGNDENGRDGNRRERAERKSGGPMLAAMFPTRIVLIHGAATTAAIWSGVSSSLAALFPTVPVIAPQRAYSGDLATETDALANVCADAVVVGVSGGATLGLALLAAVEVV